MAGTSKRGLLAWALTCVLGFVGTSQARVETAEGRHFEIAGMDRASVQFVDELSARVLIEAGRYLGEQPDSFPQRILVTLRPGDESPEAADYRISIETGGFVRVDFNWRKDLSYLDLCRGLMDAYLARYAIFHHGYDAPEKVKAWVVSALGRQTYLSLRPAVYLGWQESLLRSGTPPGPSLVTTAVEVRANGTGLAPFLLLMAMRNADFSRETVRGLCRAGVAGVDVAGLLTAAIQPPDPGADPVALHDWWRENMAEILSDPVVRFDSLEDSNRWIKELSETREFMDAGFRAENLRDLWEFRSEASVRAAVEIRLGRIVAHIERVNPAFRNAAQSLGLLYESLLNGKQEHVYIFALTRFLGDFSDARRLREDMDSALNEKNSP